LPVENRGSRAGVRGWVGGAVGRDAQVLVEITRIGADISVGPYSSTAVPLMWSESIAAPSRNPAAIGLNRLKQSRGGSIAHADLRRTQVRKQLVCAQIAWLALSRMACVMSGRDR
jgi:hypothetical protein